MSSGSYPAIACSIRATSSTERHIHPTVSSVQLTGTTPCRLILPKLGLNPTTPLYDAGRSTDPHRLRPQRRRTHPRRHPKPRTRCSTPPGVQAASPRIERRRRVHAGELRRHRLPHDDRPPPPSTGGPRGAVELRHEVRVHLGAGRRRDPRRVVNILQPDGNPVQRPQRIP